MPPKSYTGSCHCKAIRFTTTLDLTNTLTGKCNCSICFKTRAWEFTISPSDFHLNPDSEQHLTDYTFGTKQVHHLFCKVCGVRAFGRGDWPGWLGEFVSVSVVCLDGVGDEELAALGTVWRNGREEKWGEEPVVKTHL